MLENDNDPLGNEQRPRDSKVMNALVVFVAIGFLVMIGGLVLDFMALGN